MDQPAIHSHWITADGETGSAGSASALFPYWSFTKTVIAICAVKLSEDERLDLDAPLPDAPYALRQLLTHTAGLPDYGQFPAYGQAVRAREVPWSRDRMLSVALSKGMLFAPGDGWSYSNVGYMFAVEAIEAATGQPLDDVIADLVTTPLGVTGVRIARSPADFATLHWPEASSYDPAWVYHRCLIGPAAGAAQILHGLFMGRLISRDSLAEMQRMIPLGGTLPGRPWATHGYALGLMAGTATGLGRAIGHSGAGPFCVNAVYHFPDADRPVTVASFAHGPDEGVAEYAATAIAAQGSQVL